MNDAQPELVCPLCHGQLAGSTPGDRCPRDGRVLIAAGRLTDAAADPLLGQLLAERYAIFDLLGRGGFGCVYLARQQPLGRLVAVKTIRPDADPSGLDLPTRFFHEARLLASLRSPGIVRVFDYGQTPAGLLYMVMEYIPGRPLNERLREVGRLPAPLALELTDQLLAALEEPHAAGLVHRDLKPSNILVVPERNGRETVRIIDFGIAKMLGERDDAAPHTRTGLTLGTPAYMAPEQLRLLEVGPATDQYAVGVLLYQLLSGRVPFGGTTAEIMAGHLKEQVPSLPAEMGLPPRLGEVIGRALAKDPAQRFPDVAAMRQALLACQAEVDAAGPHLQAGPALLEPSSEHPSRARHHRSPPRPPRLSRGALVGLALVAVLAAFSLSGALWLLTHPAPTPRLRAGLAADAQRPAAPAESPLEQLAAISRPPDEPPMATPPELPPPSTSPTATPLADQPRAAAPPPRNTATAPAAPTATAPAAARPIPRSQPQSKPGPEQQTRAADQEWASVAAQVRLALRECRCGKAQRLLEQLPVARYPELGRQVDACQYPKPGQRCMDGEIR